MAVKHVKVTGVVGDSVNVELLGSHSISAVKEMIAGLCEGFPEYYSLEWNGVELQNDKTVEGYGINNGDTITARG